MSSIRPISRKKNLLLAFDAFGTLFEPNCPIPQAYGKAALRHGIRFIDKSEHQLKSEDCAPVKKSFSRAFKHESAQNPNYGKATGLGAEKWWANVINNTFHPFLEPTQKVPEALISELLDRYSTRKGYDLFPDVLPFFRMLKSPSIHRTLMNTTTTTPTPTTKSPVMQKSTTPAWPWDKTVVGIITNSDDRVPSVLDSFGLKVGPRRVGSSAERSSQATIDEDISFVVLSYDVGFEKPDRRIFEAAERMLEETLAESGENADGQEIDGYEKLYVGDSLEKDYLGAKAAGWNAVLLDRGKNFEDPLARMDPTDFVGLESGEQVVEMCSELSALHLWSPNRD